MFPPLDEFSEGVVVNRQRHRQNYCYNRQNLEDPQHNIQSTVHTHSRFSTRTVDLHFTKSAIQHPTAVSVEIANTKSGQAPYVQRDTSKYFSLNGTCNTATQGRP